MISSASLVLEEEGMGPLAAPPTISLVPESGPQVAGGEKSALDRPVEGRSRAAWMAGVRPKISNVSGKNFNFNVSGMNSYSRFFKFNI